MAAAGTSVLLVEQKALAALESSDWGYVLAGGTTALRPKAADPWEAVPPPPNDAQLWSRPSPTFGSARAAPSTAGDPWISPPQQREETAPVEPAQSWNPVAEPLSHL